MLRAIREIQPTYVVGENVRGLTNWNGVLVFDEVQSDLETAGYEVTPFLLPACAVNAPHRRDRIWFIAYSKDLGFKRTQSEFKQGNQNFKWSIYKSEKGRNEIRAITNGFGETESFTNTSGSGRIQNNEQQSSGEFKYACTSWERFPTQSPICNGDDGLSSRLDGITFPKWRSESIKAGGNAIVPAVALQIFKAIQLMENGNGFKAIEQNRLDTDRTVL